MYKTSPCFLGLERANSTVRIVLYTPEYFLTSIPKDQHPFPKVAFSAEHLEAQEGLQQCFDALNESNNKLSVVWKRREQLYKECCQRIKDFKDEENVLKNSGPSDLQKVQHTISKLTSAGGHFEKAMREYQKFGSDLREEIDLNLRHMTTESHLLEKIRSIINPDPDVKNQKVMDTIFEYYMGLGNLYSLLVTRSELIKPQRMVRAYIIDKFYMEIEAAVIQFLERCRLASLNTDKIAEQTLMHEIKEFYQKVFFHNLHLFYTLLFRESSAIINIVEGLADLSVRYQLSYEDISNRAKEINSQVSTQDPQRIQIFNLLQKELEQSLRQFNDTIFAKAGHPEEVKTGFLGGLFGGPKPVTQPATKEAEAAFTLEEEGFFQELMLRRKQWIAKTQESKERVVLRKELLDFCLSSNLLNSILYENTFREMLNKTREVSKSTDLLEQLYSQLDEVLREVLTLQKKRVRSVLSLQTAGNQPELIMQKLGELEIVKHSLKFLVNKVQRCDEPAADIVPTVLRSYITRLEAAVAQEAAGFKSLKEDCERKLLNPGGTRTNMDSIKTLLEIGLSRWNKELYSQTQVLKLNFFSLYDTDLEQIEVHFAKCFEGISRTGIGVMRLQEAVSTPVEQLINLFEEADYFLKKLITGLKTVSISKITIFSNLKYGTNNFLTDDQGSGNEAEQLLVSLKDNRTSLATLLEALVTKAASPHPASESIFPLYKTICLQAADLTDYLLMIYEALYQQWFSINREFKRISKEKDVAFWLKNYQKFRQVDCDRKAFTQLLKPKDEFSDLNVFLDEIFGLFQEALKSGVLVVDFSAEAKQLASSLLPDADGRQKTQQSITSGLQKVADLLSQRSAEIADLDKKVKTFTHSEGYLFILGDSVRKYRLWMMEDKVAPQDLLLAFRNWLTAIQELVEAWHQKRKSPEVLVRDLAGVDTNKIGKWISTRRYHELLAHLFRNVN